MVDFKDRLAQAMALPRPGGGVTTVTMLALACGCTYQAVKKWTVSPTAKLSAENNAAAAHFMGVRSDWLATGKGSMREGPAHLLGEPSAGYDTWPFASITPDEWARIPRGLRDGLEQQIKALVPNVQRQQNVA